MINGVHEMYLTCDDVDATVTALAEKHRKV